MDTPQELKPSPKTLIPTMGDPPELAPAETHSSSRPLRCSTGSSLISWPNVPLCMTPVASLQLPSMKTLHSHQNNALRPSMHMGGTWRRPLLPECEQSDKGGES